MSTALTLMDRGVDTTDVIIRPGVIRLDDDHHLVFGTNVDADVGVAPIICQVVNVRTGITRGTAVTFGQKPADHSIDAQLFPGTHKVVITWMEVDSLYDTSSPFTHIVGPYYCILDWDGAMGITAGTPALIPGASAGAYYQRPRVACLTSTLCSFARRFCTLSGTVLSLAVTSDPGGGNFDLVTRVSDDTVALVSGGFVSVQLAQLSGGVVTLGNEWSLPYAGHVYTIASRLIVGGYEIEHTGLTITGATLHGGYPDIPSPVANAAGTQVFGTTSGTGDGNVAFMYDATTLALVATGNIVLNNGDTGTLGVRSDMRSCSDGNARLVVVGSDGFYRGHNIVYLFEVRQRFVCLSDEVQYDVPEGMWLFRETSGYTIEDQTGHGHTLYRRRRWVYQPGVSGSTTASPHVNYFYPGSTSYSLEASFYNASAGRLVLGAVFLRDQPEVPHAIADPAWTVLSNTTTTVTRDGVTRNARVMLLTRPYVTAPSSPPITVTGSAGSDYNTCSMSTTMFFLPADLTFQDAAIALGPPSTTPTAVLPVPTCAVDHEVDISGVSVEYDIGYGVGIGYAGGPLQISPFANAGETFPNFGTMQGAATPGTERVIAAMTVAYTRNAGWGPPATLDQHPAPICDPGCADAAANRYLALSFYDGYADKFETPTFGSALVPQPLTVEYIIRLGGDPGYSSDLAAWGGFPYGGINFFHFSPPPNGGHPFTGPTGVPIPITSDGDCWKHVVLTYDPAISTWGHWEVYVNGMNVTSFDQEGTATIAGMLFVDSQFRIALAAAYKHVLSPTRIQAHFSHLCRLCGNTWQSGQVLKGSSQFLAMEAQSVKIRQRPR